MDRQVLIDELSDAMQDAQDMDTSFHDYARAAVDRLGWRRMDKEPPDKGDMVIATNGKARWMDMFLPEFGTMAWQGHIATHWHPVLDLPSFDIKTQDRP